MSLAIALVVATGSAAAQTEGARVTEHQFAFALFTQDGHGFQSQAGELGQAGSEDILVFQPQARVHIEQSDSISHDVVLSADVVSAASPDAVDVISQASKWQEEGTIGAQTTLAIDDDNRLAARYGIAAEENLFSSFGGLEVQRDFADDNTTLSAGVDAIVDAFADYRRDGYELPGSAVRGTVSANTSIGQLLSPTTVGWLGYGLTFQGGALATSHNTAPLEFGGRIKERFPDRRWRQAVSARIAQRFPSLDSTLRVGYRYYRDTFDLTAHTADIEIYRSLGDRLLARVSYRAHQQSGVRFFAESFPATIDSDAPLTSDSDLAPLWAHEVGAKLRVRISDDFAVDVSYLRYVRNNDLAIDVVAVGYTMQL